jgi:hypothetical protein
MKISGWQRIGIAATVAWWIGCGVHFKNQYDWHLETAADAQRLNADYVAKKAECERLNMSGPPWDYFGCKSTLSTMPYPVVAVDGPALWGVVYDCVGLPFLGWIGVWILFATLRWIARGFREVKP